MDFKGKVALVTGGSSGIGAKVVEILSDLGGKVYFTYNKTKPHPKKNTIPIRIDLAQEDSGLLVYGKVDIFIHSAGIWPEEDYDVTTWRRIYEINLFSAIPILEMVIPQMKAKGSGSIVFISSTAGRRGEPHHACYASTKGAIISLVKTLASELGPYGIRTNAVAPGWVYTPMSDPALRTESKNIISTIPLRRIAEVEDIARAIIFLIQAEHVNGAVLDINGGVV